MNVTTSRSAVSSTRSGRRSRGSMFATAGLLAAIGIGLATGPLHVSGASASTPNGQKIETRVVADAASKLKLPKLPVLNLRQRRQPSHADARAGADAAAGARRTAESAVQRERTAGGLD